MLFCYRGNNKTHMPASLKSKVANVFFKFNRDSECADSTDEYKNIENQILINFRKWSDTDR